MTPLNSKNRNGTITACTEHMREAGPGVGNLAWSRGAAQLCDQLEHLAQVRGTDRLAFADQTPAHIDRLAAGDVGYAFHCQSPALAGSAYAQTLQGFDFAEGVGVLNLEAIDVLRTKTGRRVGLACSFFSRTRVGSPSTHAVDRTAQVGRIARDCVRTGSDADGFARE